ncbi:hypothetical protein IWW57_001677, partial [Coemansia sp. S610]
TTETIAPEAIVTAALSAVAAKAGIVEPEPVPVVKATVDVMEPVQTVECTIDVLLLGTPKCTFESTDTSASNAAKHPSAGSPDAPDKKKQHMHGYCGGCSKNRKRCANLEATQIQEPVDDLHHGLPVAQSGAPVSPANPAEQMPVDTAKIRKSADASEALSEAMLPVESCSNTCKVNHGAHPQNTASISKQRHSSWAK